jgi:heterodisulfide reductase subunit A
MNKLIIDGIEVEPDPKRTILEVATELGIYIPTLCYHKSLSPYGACRICTVETIWKGRSKLQTACTFPAWEGEVRTNSEPVRRLRRILLELMLAEAPEAEEIKKLAEEYGVKKSRFRKREKENSKCILCGLCVRFCRDVVKSAAVGFKNRGSDREIAPPFDASNDECRLCGACESVCPTNAIEASSVAGVEPVPIASEFNAGICGRKAIYTPFPQAVPNVPVIDETVCMYLRNGTCRVCEQVCSPNAIEYDQVEKTEEINVGAIIVATGFDPFDARIKKEFGYGTYPNVITGLEFERLVSASGPTGGEVVVQGKVPKKIVFIHCVGSRDESVGNEYCSRVCCMFIAKQAHLVKEKIPGAQVTALYMDMRAFGKGYEEFYDRVRKEGVLFRRANPSEIYREGGKLIVMAEDTILGEPIELEADLVVLGTGIVPRKETEQIRRILKLSKSQDGFLLEAHPKLKPVDTALDGVYLAGCCQSPKDIPDTVSQAKGAAASALSILTRGFVTIEPVVSWIDETVCSGCGICESACEYGALKLDEIKKVMVVNEVLCKGCSACASACPSNAIILRHYTPKQLLSQIEAILS